MNLETKHVCCLIKESKDGRSDYLINSSDDDCWDDELSAKNVQKRIKFGWLMRGLVAFGFYLMGETVFWLKSLCQLGFVWLNL
jgi:hypothetical protein